MLRTVGRISAWMAIAWAGCLALAQQPAAERKTLRFQLPTQERAAPEVRIVIPRRAGADGVAEAQARKPTDRIRGSVKPRVKVAPAEPANALAALGASEPFAYSAGGSHLVAAVRDGAGLALWDTATRRRLRRLENSDRRYSLVAISDQAHWIAAVRQDNSDQIDLWRADTGRHLRVIRAAGGPKSRLEFAGSDELRVQSAGGDGFVFSIPDGVPTGRSGSRQGGSAVKKPSLRAESPKVAQPKAAAPKPAMPAAPSTARAAPPAVPLPRATIQADREPQPRAQSRAQPLTQSAPAIEPRIPASAPPRLAATQPPSTSRESRQDALSAPAIAAPVESSAGPAFEPAAAAPDEAAGAAPDEPAAMAPDEPAGGAAPDEPVGEAAPETSDDGPPEAADDAPPLPAAAAPADRVRAFRFEMEEQPAAENEPASAPPEQPSAALQPRATVPTPADAPAATSVNIHFATNRNRLTPKDRQWSIYFLSFFGSLPAFVIYGLVILAVLILPWFGKRSWAATAVLVGSVALCAMGSLEAYVRSQLRDELSGELFGCRATDLSYGSCEISVPPPRNRRPGELSRPLSVWVFEAPENPDKHFVLRRVEEHQDKEAFYRSLSWQLGKSDARAALLFIHGYNVSFEDAIFRTAQLAVDLKFPGAPVAFCWPSYADPVKYPFDEQNAEVSIPALREVLDDLAARSGAKRVHIIAHSMGNRVLAGALRSMDPSAQARSRSAVCELVLAAPDIDCRVFQSQVLPHILRSTQHCTLYASSRDRALLMSRCFHNYQRLGETQPELLIAKDLDTIDASLVDTSLLGHSYIGDVQSIVSDLHDLVVGGKRATERIGLQLFERNALQYWSIKPDLQAGADASLRR